MRSLSIQVARVTADQKRLLELYPDLRHAHFGIQDALVMARGQVSLEEARFLGATVNALKGPGPIIEVGTLFGWSTRVMCLFKEPARHLISVDNYSWNPFGFPPEIHFETTQRVMSEAINSHNVKLERMASTDFFESYTGPAPALVFIDSTHTYEVLSDEIKGARKIKSELICGHDYDAENCPGVVKAVDEAGGPSKVVGTLWIL